jgi:RND family efflux transporter MFP subunit
MDFRFRFTPLLALAAALACGEAPAAESPPDADAMDPGVVMVLRDTLLPDVVEASAVAEPMVSATLSTKLMGHVMAVLAREGERVQVGAPLVRLDARDTDARRAQAEAALRGAEAAHQEAALHAARIRALHADSAAPRAQLDAAETGLARAEQGMLAARAAVTEVAVLADYAEVRAPFGGVVVQRFVDPGAFVAPGTPLVRIEDASRLRVVAAVPPLAAAAVRRGTSVRVSIEGIPVAGIVEGVVPVPGASLASVQVLVDNRGGRFASGSAATVSLPGATRATLLVPIAALVRSGDLTGVRVRSAHGTSTRWVRLGREHGVAIEVLSGLSAGDSIVVPVEPMGA